ncbi:hypothetical protein RMN57_23385 [Kitasatospora sp. CM 4170]|uniref:Integral membrane protein n=1 Tax=Kitasatospora aburaviensis TaxID=67265 RepID=A0ABW1F825_9ACTN|nr:hypothetical protein [Kitasatospora sp. CM 4170]WNM47431.1 hypothetical protein RMN57_23385 [Kitasatospora sp. CM 4170]
MSGQYPGQFGPPPGGVPAGGIPAGAHYPGPPTGPVPLPGPGTGPAAGPGPYGALGRTLCILAPLLSFGLLGMVPSLLLAIRRRRAYDFVGAVVFTGLFLAFLVSAGIAGGHSDGTVLDKVGTVALVLLWFGAPLHFVGMDLRAVWDAGRPAPTPAAYYPAPVPPPVSPYAATAITPYPAGAPHPGGTPVRTGTPHPAGTPYPTGTPHQPPPATRFDGPVAPYATPPTARGGAPGPAPASSSETGDELRELGELLRRQAGEGRP